MRSTAGAIALGAAVFGVYVWCAYPSIAPRDSADLALAAWSLGVAHPPGYPLYALAGRLWLALLPWGNPAYRLNVLSAAAGASACALFFLWARRRLPAIAAGGLAACIAFSACLWKFGGLEEMYSAQALVVAALLLLAEGTEASRHKRAALSGLLFGLGLVNHQSLVLLAPIFSWHWRKDWRAVLSFAAPALALYAAVWIRLGRLDLAWAAVTRREYGTFTLSSSFSRPLDASGALSLLGYFLAGLARESSPLLALLGAAGAAIGARRREPAVLLAAAGLILSGPVFFLMSGFDLGGWVARTVLEPDFIVPAVLCAALAARALSALPPRWAGALAPACAAWALLYHAPLASHRDDFSAEDYVEDLRRSLPPGAAVVAGGDTAYFGLRYLEAVRPRSADLRLMTAADPAAAAFARENSALVAGLDPKTLGVEAAPRAVVQGGGAADIRAWELSLLRLPRSFDTADSYGHDVRLAYGFARYQEGRWLDAHGRDSAGSYLWAGAWDPEDYRISIERSAGGPLSAPRSE